jgi:DNA-binding CsgD family transcriptional regulator
MPPPSTGRAVADIGRACHGATGSVGVVRAVAERMQESVAFDAWCALTIDPASVLPTGGFHEHGVPAQHLTRLVEIEVRGDDTMALPILARRPGRVTTLSGATGGRPARSQHYRDILVPSGLEHELRVLFTAGAGVWGALVMFRATDSPDFSTAETTLVEAATSPVAAAIRREMMLTEITHGDEAGPGLLLLDRSLAPLSVSTAARRWLAEVDDGMDPHTELPYAVIMLANRAHAPATDHAYPLRSRIRTRTGRWLTFHAERLAGDATHVSVIIEPSRPVEIAQLIADAYQLTERERQVVRLLAGGHSRREIARLLSLSPHTVDDHIKRVFGKLGVRSRAELTSKLFFDQHLTRIETDVPVGGTGWFLH